MAWREMTLKVGQKYNKLTIVEIIRGNHFDKHRVKCICDCGNKKEANLRSVKRGRTKSCGCANTEWIKSDKFKEVQKMSSKMGADAVRLPSGESSFRNLKTVYKSGAKRRGLCWQLTDEEFKILVDGDCYYCGVGPVQVKHHKYRNGDYVYNGIDRVDNTVGYITVNCVTCCGTCNKMKMGSSLEEFLGKVRMIYEKQLKTGGH